MGFVGMVWQNLGMDDGSLKREFSLFRRLNNPGVDACRL
jgi:hypothetical protein